MKRILYSGLGLLLIAVAFLLFNGLSGALLSGARLDLTEQKLYTLSPGTRQILASLDEPLTLRLFYSDQATGELPALRNQARRVEELLRTYVRAADGSGAGCERTCFRSSTLRPRKTNGVEILGPAARSGTSRCRSRTSSRTPVPLCRGWRMPPPRAP